jgi:hypothetical protein
MITASSAMGTAMKRRIRSSGITGQATRKRQARITARGSIAGSLR